jgi:hypothetical protein
MQNEVPTWVYVMGGVSIVGIAAWTGSRWGAYLVVLIVLGMVASAIKTKKVREN